MIATLREEVASRVREVAELHGVILAQAKALESRTALPTTVDAAASAPSSPDAIAQAAPTVERAPGSWWELIRRSRRGA